jgi:hypothetical protein
MMKKLLVKASVKLNKNVVWKMDIDVGAAAFMQTFHNLRLRS